MMYDTCYIESTNKYATQTTRTYHEFTVVYEKTKGALPIYVAGMEQ